MKARNKRKKPVIIDVEPVEVETSAVTVTRPASRARARYVPAPGEIPIPYPDAPVVESSVNPPGRLDIAAYRAAVEYALPWAEAVMGVPGLARVLEPWAEAFISEYVPDVNIFKSAPKPRRRLR
jgi:hypothetical protein